MCVESPAVIESHVVKIKDEDAPLSVRFLYFLAIAALSSASNGCARLDCEVLVRGEGRFIAKFQRPKESLNNALSKSGLLAHLLKLFRAK